VNLCTGCGQDFASVFAFDAHRVGTFAYDFSPERPEGRRCLAVAELVERGFAKDKRDRWQHPRHVRERARNTVCEPAYSTQNATEALARSSSSEVVLALPSEFCNGCADCGARVEPGDAGISASQGPTGPQESRSGRVGGRRRLFCSPACRQRAYRRRKGAG
jgi:hypothetical protein